MNVRRLLLYLGLNALVSASATLAVLWVWDRTRAQPPPANLPLPATASAALPTSPPAARADTPTSPPPTPTVYVVQSGDTLGSIAQLFDVSVEDLMAANGLTDPNVLSVGQQLVIPLGGLDPPTATAAPTVEPPRPTATRDPNVPLPRLSIREVRAPGQPNSEAVVIVNSGGPVDLAGWTLRDEAGHLYRFPALTLFEGGAVSVHTGAGEDTVTDLYWGQAGTVWAPGKVALLSDPNGNLQARYTVP